MVSLAPLLSIAHGSSSIWTCENCESAYEIRTHFTPLEPQMMALVEGAFSTNQNVDGNGDESDARAMDAPENAIQRLVEILGEILFLRDRLANREEEAHRLRERLRPFT
jgi:hypothetical protein